MSWRELSTNTLKAILNYSVAHPIVAIAGLLGILLLSLLASHWLDAAEGSFRNKVLWFLFVIILATVIVLVLVGLSNGVISLD